MGNKKSCEKYFCIKLLLFSQWENCNAKHSSRCLFTKKTTKHANQTLKVAETTCSWAQCELLGVKTPPKSQVDPGGGESQNCWDEEKNK